MAWGISPKSRLATTLLAFFLGVFGAHRFYIGKTVTAIVMLLLGIAGLATILATLWPLNTEWFFVGVSFIAVVGIWAFVDFIFAVIGRMKDDESRLIQKWGLVVPAGRTSPKSRLSTTLLAFFLGIFGAHRFYIGKTITAIVMLLLGIVGLATLLATLWPLNIEWLFLGASFITAVGIWAFVDFIFAVSGSMKDSEGRFIQKWGLVVPAGDISPKSRLDTSLLAFFLGAFGAHRFYIGKSNTATVMFLLGIVGLATLGLAAILQLNVEWFFVGVSFIIAAGIWAFIDFILAVSGSMKDSEGRFIQKWWLVVPASEREYYIKYAITTLRVIAWIILVVGLIGSLVWGTTMGGTEGGVQIVIGVIGSFLAWLALLAARELLKLFMDVKGNTINTAERLTKEPN